MPDNRQIEDSQILAEIKDYARELKARYAQRDLDARNYEDVYLMDWAKKDDPELKTQRVTIESGGREAVEGATRLMIATEPAWSVEGDEVPDASGIETELKRWWSNSGHAAGSPHEHDLIRSGILYASMDAAISPTQDLLARARKGKSKGEVTAAERLVERTPFVVDVWNPKQGYPVRDVFGLAAYYRVTEMSVKEANARYGPLPADLLERSRYGNVTIHIFYDRDYYACWIGAGSASGEYDLTCKKHKLPAIPIMQQIVDGSMLFDKPEYQAQPLLYTLVKSGLWDSMNLYLTVAFTTILAMGTVPKWLHISPPGQTKRLDWDWKTFVAELEAGESVQPLLAKGLLDPDAAQMYQLAQQKLENATIFRQALGAPINRGSTTFSEISLLAQAGRLPLIGPQRRGSWGIAELGYLMLQWAREEPRHLSGTQLKRGDIPSQYEVNAKLQISLPQDQLQNANLLRLLTQGDDPIVSKAWGLENILNIGQPEEMQEQIWNERGANAMYALQLQQIQREMQQRLAQAQEQQAAAAAGRQQFPGAGMPPGMPQGMPPEPPPNQPPQAGPMMGSPDQAEMMQGIPPQQAGMLPGMGQGAVPPGSEEMMA